MGFGYRQAREAGLGGIRGSRSPQQVNRLIEETKIARKLREIVTDDPEWAPFVQHWIMEKLPPADILQSYYNARHDASLRKRGWRNNRFAPF